ncbi:DUF4232 domain-containing protein [Streptomyces sp. P6-2-1]|uniref:DUF4232 domain-containing protein n=1 Tax=unclassified Streptomyces TaxID=2593676 RepID=UPI003D3633FA
MSLLTPRAARTTAAALAVLALGAGVAACDSGDDSPKAASAATPSGGAPAQDASQEDDGGRGAASGAAPQEKGQNDDGINGPTEQAKPRGAHCDTSELNFDFHAPHGGKPDMEQEKYQQSVTVRLTNHGERSCTLKGFPGVQLVSAKGERWDLARSGDRPDLITLKPGDDTAAIKFTVMPSTDPEARTFVPQDVVMTLPDETEHITLPWEFGGAILDQSGATHPGTFVDPIGY